MIEKNYIKQFYLKGKVAGKNVVEEDDDDEVSY
jgi:hypothetical protein